MQPPPVHSRDPLGWCWALTLAFLALVLWRIGIPSKPYFDEMHYLPAARELLAMGTFSNREHPLLGKELLAIGIALFGDSPTGWRIAPALAGALAMFAFMRALWFAACSRFAAVAGGILFATGIFAFVHARIAMLDIFMVAFLLTAFWQCAAAMREPERGRLRLAVAGIMLGAAMAAKWNAVPLAVLPGLGFLAVKLQRRGLEGLFAARGRPVRGIGLAEAALWLGIVPLLVYAATFLPAIGFAQQPLSGLWAHHVLMLDLQTQILAPHPYQSGWADWLLTLRPIWYLYEPVDGAQRGVLLIGNPATMWLGLPAIIWCGWRGFYRKDPAPLAVFVLFAVSLGFWIVAAKPVQFYYHYFLPSCALLAALALACDAVWRAGRKWLALTPILGGAAMFAWFYPIISAAPLAGPGSFTDWMWLDSWS
ncbi:putative dolichyl-phosphate-mannose--protein mannosyltransferase [Alteripontixanthobacter maritimus]|uniref:Polyprenol-phosphate-mannose--protein mannosyltransferase n=1 Tax=Alteripontixanthobacter maritimus TaxID=2161824 RepID=A0A369Q977_9SPHN|nr:phospholipid carrier-dependent glycosyltransferase [Alteripontixanthobacter maritimus]RDC59469.1 putative dolichyl-phosphate-mannose--protein mannosyltransferase [Alteripontixanthobacter maritimus]